MELEDLFDRPGILPGSQSEALGVPTCLQGYGPVNSCRCTTISLHNGAQLAVHRQLGQIGQISWRQGLQTL
jgi:hypothetical protein